MLYKGFPPQEVRGKAMILAAGLGTRLKPWTDKHPKGLAVVNGKPLLQRNIEYLQQYGITDVVVNVHHFADQLIDATETNNGWGSNISISDETQEVLETGGGLLKAASFLRESEWFVLMNVDVLTDLPLNEMLAFHKQQNPLATLATSDRSTSRYLLFDESNRLMGWENVKTGEQKLSNNNAYHSLQRRAFSGIHIISPRIFDYIILTGKFSMIDLYLSLMNDHSILSFDHTGSKFIDVGKPESIEQAEKMFIG